MKIEGWTVVILVLLIGLSFCQNDLEKESTLEKAEPLERNEVGDLQAETEPNQNGGNKNAENAGGHENAQNAGGQGAEEEEGHHRLTPDQPQFCAGLMQLQSEIVLCCCGAFCSGMGVGLLSISKLQLNMMKLQSNEVEKKKAERILSVVNHHHLFLVTLLIANAIALQSLPLVIHSFMPDWLAIITSTILVLVIAEIIPQAVCTGPNKMMIAYYACPIIYWMIRIFWIIGFPTAKLLDYLVGKGHDQKIKHKDFGTFLNQDKFLNKTEKLLLTSTLDLRGDRVRDTMIPAKEFFMLEERQVIDEKVVDEIIRRDYSYILVYKGHRSSIIGTIKVKEFAILYLKSGKKEMFAGEVMHHTTEKMLTVYEDTNLLEMLMLFQAKSTRFALVVNAVRKIDKGILTIMYTKSDMIYQEAGAEVIGVVFLYQIFNEMVKIREKKILVTDRIIRDQQPGSEIEMETLSRGLLQRQ